MHQTKAKLDVYTVDRFSNDKKDLEMESGSSHDYGYSGSNSGGSNSGSPSERSSEGSSASTSGSTKSWAKTLSECPHITTAHGVSKITEPTPYKLRRYFMFSDNVLSFLCIHLFTFSFFFDLLLPISTRTTIAP